MTETIPLTAEVIEGFVGSCLKKGFDGQLDTPNAHKEFWQLCCSPHKRVAIAAPRGHAKSTAVTLSYGLSALLFRKSKFLVIVSDTESQAINFVNQIKAELTCNENIISLFGLRKDETGKIKLIKDSETDVIGIFEDGELFRIIAKGAEQKLRGLLWNGTRPDLFIIDDLENEDLVMNKDRREKFRRWFYGALLPALSLNGQVRYVGTILHIDALLERLMPSERDINTEVTPLCTRTLKPKNGWMSAKYRAHNPDFSEILWPAKWSKETLQAERSAYQAQGLGDVYSQEMLNTPLDDSNTFFRKPDFLPMKDSDRQKNMRYYITSDLAISQRERADYSVFLVGGVDDVGNLNIVHCLRARLDGKDIVATILALQKKYQPEVFGIEEMQVSKAIGPFLREAMRRNNCFVNIELMKHGGYDKTARARSIQARMRSHSVKFDQTAMWYGDFEEECLRFPRDRHDDQVDALSYMGLLLDKIIDAPTDKELEEEEYDQEFGNSTRDQGRSRVTGY